MVRGKSIYLILRTPLSPSPVKLAVADSSLPADSLFLGFLTSHHVPLGHIEGRGVAVCIGGIFKQD